MDFAPDFSRLHQLIEVEWDEPTLLAEALRDESFVNENQNHALKSNKNLAFLGDAVIELAIRSDLVAQRPSATRDELSKTADEFVSDIALAQAARRLKLGPSLALGNNRRDEDNPTVLARGFEALFGAIYLDKGFRTAADLATQSLNSTTD